MCEMIFSATSKWLINFHILSLSIYLAHYNFYACSRIIKKHISNLNFCYNCCNAGCNIIHYHCIVNRFAFANLFFILYPKMNNIFVFFYCFSTQFN